MLLVIGGRGHISPLEQPGANYKDYVLMSFVTSFSTDSEEADWVEALSYINAYYKHAVQTACNCVYSEVLNTLQFDLVYRSLSLNGSLANTPLSISNLHITGSAVVCCEAQLVGNVTIGEYE